MNILCQQTLLAEIVLTLPDDCFHEKKTLLFIAVLEIQLPTCDRFKMWARLFKTNDLVVNKMYFQRYVKNAILYRKILANLIYTLEDFMYP